MERSQELSRSERRLLLLPLLAGVFFGLGPLLLPGPFGVFLGGQGTDPYIYQLAGAATFGYAVALLGALQAGGWVAVRLPVLAVLVFNLASLIACGTAIAGGTAAPMVYVILVASLGFIALTATLLRRHGLVSAGAPDLAPWLVGLLAIATAAATVFGLVPLFAPTFFGHFFGYGAADTFVYQQAGAATLGYAVMGVFELRSRHWTEVRWPLVMAAVFNGVSFLISLLALATGQPSWLPFVVTPAALLVSGGFLVALRGERARAVVPPAPAGSATR
jgi:hypothetical protein